MTTTDAKDLPENDVDVPNRDYWRGEGIEDVEVKELPYEWVGKPLSESYNQNPARLRDTIFKGEDLQGFKGILLDHPTFGLKLGKDWGTKAQFLQEKMCILEG